MKLSVLQEDLIRRLMDTQDAHDEYVEMCRDECIEPNVLCLADLTATTFQLEAELALQKIIHSRSYTP